MDDAGDRSDLSTAGRLCVVAGSGQLPARVIAAAVRAGRTPFVLALKGETDPAILNGLPHFWSRIGAGGSAIEKLRREGVTELVFAGAVRRPSLYSLRPDLRTARFFARIGRRAFGDDGLLSAVIQEVEAEGFRVLPVQEVLDDALAGAGAMTRALPDTQGWSDIRRGFEIAHQLGRLDVGQAVVVQMGVVLGVEAVEGTDALIERCRRLLRPGPPGVLVKAAKPQQERRIDLPTIGHRTIRRARRNGLGGIAVEAGGALIIDRDAVGAEADRLGLFLVGIDPAALTATGGGSEP